MEPDHSPHTAEEIHAAHSALEEARHEFEEEIISQDDLENIEAQYDAMVDSVSYGNSLALLSKTSHSTVEDTPAELIPDLIESRPIGYLNPDHEEVYLTALDEFFDSADPEDGLLPPQAKPSDREREREAITNNPMSVHNWLVQHRPKELAEDDNGHEKAAKASRKTSPKPPTSTPGQGKSSAKREKQPRQEEEVLDEDGSVLAGYAEDFTGPQKKRKRAADDDNAYRPKGSSGNASKKRKRASTKNSGTEAAAA